MWQEKYWILTDCLKFLYMKFREICLTIITHQKSLLIYIFFKIRSALVPVVNFVSYLGYFGLLISIIGGLTGYIKLSIIILLATVLFQLVTLPVEIDASKRALVQLEELNLVYNDENKSAKKVLSAAAMTYIASLLSSILDLLRLILILNSRNDDRR